MVHKFILGSFVVAGLLVLSPFIFEWGGWINPHGSEWLHALAWIFFGLILIANMIFLSKKGNKERAWEEFWRRNQPIEPENFSNLKEYAIELAKSHGVADDVVFFQHSKGISDLSLLVQKSENDTKLKISISEDILCSDTPNFSVLRSFVAKDIIELKYGFCQVRDFLNILFQTTFLFIPWAIAGVVSFAALTEGTKKESFGGPGGVLLMVISLGVGWVFFLCLRRILLETVSNIEMSLRDSITDEYVSIIQNDIEEIRNAAKLIPNNLEPEQMIAASSQIFIDDSFIGEGKAYLGRFRAYSVSRLDKAAV